MLDDLYDRDRSGRALVTASLAAGMVVTSLSALAWPEVGDLLGGVGRLHYPWQVWTSAFMHGWPGFPLLVHLFVNLVLIGFVGVAAEKLLGAARYLAVTALALGLYWLARRLTGIEANGASVFLWAYAPILFVAMRHVVRSGRPLTDAYQRAKGFLVIMWVVVPVFMVGILAVRGTAILTAVAFGNVFHLSATVAGVAGAVAWRERIRRRAGTGRFPVTAADRAAAVAAAAIPVVLASLVALVVRGTIAP